MVVNSFAIPIFFCCKKQKRDNMERAPNKKEQDAVRTYCFQSRSLANHKASFAKQKKPLNAALKECRADMMDVFRAENTTCYKIDQDKFLRLKTSTTRGKVTENNVHESVGNEVSTFTGDKGVLVKQIVKRINENRTTSREYATMVQTPPKKAVDVVVPTGEVKERVDALVRTYTATTQALEQIRSTEKEHTGTLEQEIKRIEPSVKAYMDRTNIQTQRIYLKDPDVSGISQTFFLKKKQYAKRVTITNELLTGVVETILAKIPVATIPNLGTIIANDIWTELTSLGGETVDRVHFDRGSLCKKH